MKVKLFACSQPIESEIEGLEDIQDIIAYCAKVSNPQFQKQFDSSDRLLRYLIKHQHWSPFEMVSATMEIETTRDIARQMLRHRSFSFQEFSQRYKEVDALGESFVIREARLQHPTNRQDSVELDLTREYYRDIDREWRRRQEAVIKAAKEAYDWALSAEIGIAKEQARVVLPEGNTVSRLYMQGTIRSWIHYIELRSANGTQKEHMLIAKEIGKAISKIFPLATTINNKEKQNDN
jgi:thymidylate synthase (FAD)